MSREFLFMDTTPEPPEPDEEAGTDQQEPVRAPSPDRWKTIIDSNLIIEPGSNIDDTPVPKRNVDTY